MKLNIIYRVCDGVEVCSAHRRCFDVGKRKLVRKCFGRLRANADAFIKREGAGNFRLICVHDHCSDETLAYIKAEAPYAEFVKPGVPGNAGSFCQCVEEASRLPDGEIAYFLEDDYLFLQDDVLLKLVYNMQRLSQYEGRPAAIMPDDYPDRYRDNTYRGTVRVTETGHFIKIDSTTCTFAVFTDSVKRNKEHLMRFAAWPRLGEAKSVNMLWQPRGEIPLYSPVPAWTVHAQTRAVLPIYLNFAALESFFRGGNGEKREIRWHMRKSDAAKLDLKQLTDSLGGKTGLTLVEIGSYMGESARLFAESGKFSRVICVDPWADIPGNDGNAYMGMSDVEKAFDENTKDFGCIEKFKGTADDLVASGRLDGVSVDMVYIDGLHTYEGCSHDISVCRGAIRPRLAFSGHDYTDRIAHVAGVKKAVDEAFGAPDAVFCDNSWIKFVK